MKKTICLLAGLFIFSVAHAGSITNTGVGQGDLVKLLTNMTRAHNFHMVSSANLTRSETVTTDLNIGTTLDAILYVSSGNMYSMDASNNIHVVAPSADAQATGTICDYLLTFNHLTSVFSINGGNAETVTNNVKLPAVPAGGIPIGVIRLSTGTATTFNFGIEGLDTAAYTVTYRDIYVPNTGPSKIDLNDL